MTASLKFNMEGWYRLKVRRLDGSTKVDTGWFPNLITDNGLDLVYNTPAGTFGIKYFNVATCVGSGNTPPAVTDTTLETLVATERDPNDFKFSTVTFVDEVGVTPAYWKSVASWRFATGAAAGNLTEIGVGYDYDNLFSRALIVDGAGNPTTITVLADEVLDVTYELRVYIDKSQVPFTIDISGTNYSGYVQPYNIGSVPSFSTAINLGDDPSPMRLIAWSQHTEPASVYASVSGSNTSDNPTLINPYVPGTYYLDLRYQFSQSQANYSGNNIFTLKQANFMSWLIWFDDQIPKQNYQNLSLDIRVSWGRYVAP
jgi:hypothetical protein